MKEEKHIKYISSLIIRNLQDDLTEPEKEELQKWREESPDNEHLFRKLLLHQNLFAGYTRYKQSEKNDDWQILLRRIKSRNRKSWNTFFKYAAIVLFIFSAGVYFIKWQKDHEVQNPEVVQTGIVPGSTKAILEFASGKRVYLDKKEEKLGRLLKQYGISEEDSLLAYRSSETVLANEYHTLVVPRGGEFILALEDGTKVWINAESVLKYPVRFTDGQRKVYLLEGEAYFRVERDTLRPFYVETSGMTVCVTGTEFNVMAYKNKETVETTLAKGAVNISVGDQSTKLLPGDQAVFSKSRGELVKKQVDVSYYTSWKEGIFEFEDMPLQEVAEQLGRWYDVDFFFMNENVKHVCFTGAVRKTRSLEFILNIIRDTRAVNYQIKGKTITIYN